MYCDADAYTYLKEGMRNMNYSQIKTWIDLAVAGIGTFFSWYLGAAYGPLYALCALAVLDYLSGVANAIVNKKVSSEIGFKGIAKKVLMFALVGVGNLIDTYVIGTGDATRSAVIFFYISNEGISLIENAVALGLPVPRVLKKLLSNSDKLQLDEKNPQKPARDGSDSGDGGGNDKGDDGGNDGGDGDERK